MTVETATTPMLLLGLEGQLFAIESQLRVLRQVQSGNPVEQWQQFAIRAFSHVQTLAGGVARGSDGGWSDWLTTAGRAWLRSAEALSNVPPPAMTCQPLIDALETYASTLRDTIHRLSAGQHAEA